MRRSVLTFALLLAGCATRPQQPAQTPQTIVTPSPHTRSDLLGLTANDLVQRFGNPALQIREGAGLKLQFRRRGCVLDAYLYAAPAGGVQRVAHVDTRWPTGADPDQTACITALDSP